jgi:hypothetical protein
MKRRTPKFDPLEETLENPDLPPIVAGRIEVRPRAVQPRRTGRIALALCACALVVMALGLKLVA